MNKQTARKIADALTWSRVWAVIPITVLAWYQLKWWVFALYVVAAITDLLDGMFARRAAPPKNDLDLDGLADLLFSVMSMLWLWMLIPGFFPKCWLPYLPLLVVLEIYMISARIRYQHLVVPHLEFGRFAMALFFFLLPVLIIWVDVPWFVHLVFSVGTLGMIQLTVEITRRVKAQHRCVDAAEH
jgi:phosphatidylglycerophosphate synthase